MPIINKAFTFSNGTIADAVEVNSDFDPLYALVNGALDSANINQGASFVWTGSHSFIGTGGLRVRDTANAQVFIFAAAGALASNRFVVLPVLTGNDTLVFESHPQTLSNKTLDDADGTLDTPGIDDFSNAPHDHSDAAGGGQLDADALALTSHPAGIHLPMAGTCDAVDDNNYGKVFFSLPLANMTTKLTVVGALFNPAHYTELRAHNHGGTTGAHTHSVTGNTGNSPSLSHDHAVGTLATANESSHTHSFSATSGSTDPSHSHNMPINIDTGDAGPVDRLPGGANTTWATNTANIAHTHSVSGTTGTGAAHSHTITGNTASNALGTHTHTISGTADSQSPTIATQGTTTATALTAAEKTYHNSMSIYIDGVNRTADLLALAEANYPTFFSNFGDGTAGHRLNNESTAAPGPGTGAMDISTFLTTAGFHKIEFRGGAATGGNVNWFLESY